MVAGKTMNEVYSVLRSMSVPQLLVGYGEFLDAFKESPAHQAIIAKQLDLTIQRKKAGIWK